MPTTKLMLTRDKARDLWETCEQYRLEFCGAGMTTFVEEVLGLHIADTCTAIEVTVSQIYTAEGILAVAQANASSIVTLYAASVRLGMDYLTSRRLMEMRLTDRPLWLIVEFHYEKKDKA